MFTLRCLVDNNTLDAASFQAEHGVAFAIEIPGEHMLFDTGQSGDVLVQNAARMGYNLRQIDALVLSHAHHDHTGGLKAVMQYSMPGLRLHAHPDIFRQRFALRDGEMRSVGLHMTQTDLAQHFTLHLNAEPVEVLRHVWTSGEITQRNEFKGRSLNHYIQGEDNWQSDPYRDDMLLILEGETGLILVCGCCHAGLLNTLAHVRRMFNREIAAIVGGAHLGGVDVDTLQHAIDVIRTDCAGQIPSFFLNHCTGDRAIATLAQAFGERVHPCPAGSVLKFD